MSATPRRHKRLLFDGAVYARCDSWGEFLYLYARNISQGGLFIRHDAMPEIGATVEMRIQTPDQKLLEITGRVVHVIDTQRATEIGVPSGFGVEFVEVSPEQAEALARVIMIAKKHQAAPPPPLR